MNNKLGNSGFCFNTSILITTVWAKAVSVTRFVHFSIQFGYFLFDWADKNVFGSLR